MRPTSPNVGRPFAAESSNARGAAKVEKTPAANSVRRAAPRKEALAMRLRQKALHRKTKDRGNNAVWGHLIAVRPHPQESQSQGHAPKKDSQVVGGRRNCGSGSFLAFRPRAVQKLHSSSAEKFNRSKREDYVRTLTLIGR